MELGGFVHATNPPRCPRLRGFSGVPRAFCQLYLTVTHTSSAVAVTHVGR
jgi:hypothetical protein